MPEHGNGHGHPPVALDFIRRAVREDLHAGRHTRIVTRFPPEPNGFLHIGHAKSICLNFGIAAEHDGRCILRFDDTNPLGESETYIRAIEEDVRWMGFDSHGNATFASDYYQALYEFAERLVRQRLAYVCDLSIDEIRARRGDFTTPGVDSPWRLRSVDESLELLRRMKAGEFADGTRVLRARIDMSCANLNMRDPVIYRIRHARHPRTGNDWCIYPMYDYAHCLCDFVEGVTHSLCSLEFEDHRLLYDWFLDAVGADPGRRPRQIEFSRLEVESVVLSKRLLNVLVSDAAVTGWDDPRMWTLAGLRRRGVTAAAIRDFCRHSGVTRKYHVMEMDAFEHCLREDLERFTPRAMAVLDPVRMVIDNYPEDRTENLSAPWHPQRPELGSREIPFARELLVERGDFENDPPRRYKRLAPGADVRLRYGYVVRCEFAEFTADGVLETIHCRYYPDSLSGSDTSGVKVRGVIHWVPCVQAIPAEVRFYDHLFTDAKPVRSPEEVRRNFNTDSLRVYADARLEPALGETPPATQWQFERIGYFCRDPIDTDAGLPVWNRIVGLRNVWVRKTRGKATRDALT